ncbi:MAG: hypothetical protein R3343_04355 [Nitriliruptorales bacterium]|nr:hypothetical protein [Nitriliruptorales bacterium]
MARDSRFDVFLRSVWGRAIIALLLATVAGLVWWRLFTFLNDELEMAFVAWPVGIILAILFYYAIGFVYRRAGPRSTSLRPTTGNLAHRLERLIGALTPLVFRSHRLGRPWPIAVVTEHAVTVTRPRSLGGTLRLDDGQVLHDGKPLTGPEISEVRRLVGTLREVLPNFDVHLPVQGLIVVDDATVVPSSLTAADRDVLFSHLDQAEAAFTLGPPHGNDALVQAVDALARWRPEPR